MLDGQVDADVLGHQVGRVVSAEHLPDGAFKVVIRHVYMRGVGRKAKDIRDLL